MTWLLDGNVLVALALKQHEQHLRAIRWRDEHVQRYATCPITQGTLLRVYASYVPGARPENAMKLLLRLIDHSEHEFWPDELGYDVVPMAHLQGGKQVTDAYLAALARHHGARVATLDVAFSKLYPDDVELIP